MPTWRAKANNALDPAAPRSMVPAIIPPYAPTPASVHGGLIRFAAAPGTVPVPSPRPPGTHQRSASGDPLIQDLRPSDCAPNAFLPRLAVPFADNMGPPGPDGSPPRVCSNEIPIPAGNYRRLPMVASKTPPRIGGRGVVDTPRVRPNWPAFTPSAAAATA